MSKTIEQGNKLISEFMKVVWAIPSKCNYHSSWDSLMEVVEKINVLNDRQFDVIIFRSDCHINDKEQILIETSRMKNKETLINIVWQAIVKFIEWYNSSTDKT